MTGWEVATRLGHRDRQRTNEVGVIQAIFEPGVHHIGVGWQSFPAGYRPGDERGRQREVKAGAKQTPTFGLERVVRD